MQKQIPSSIANATIVSSLELLAYNQSYNIYYQSGLGILLRVNGLVQGVPYNDAQNNVSVFSIANGLGIQTGFEFLIELTKSVTQWSPKSAVQVPNSYKGHVCGLCGNFNGIIDDDFVDRKKQPVPLSDPNDEEHEWYSWGSKWRNGPNFGNDLDGSS